ncbi:MAG: single-stranded DNA-binding protein [Stellaceae bacterium]
MAGSLNKVTLIGNVGKDPEIRSTSSGTWIANFTLATSESWKDKHSGEKRERTEWHRVACFNEHLTKIIEKYIRKGSKLYIEGKLQTRKWTDKDGSDRYTTEVVLQAFNGTVLMLDSGGSRGDAHEETHRDNGRAAARNPADLDDEIPF